MTTFGWDASDFDWGRGPMDLAAARSAGIDFFTHKATEGTSVRHVHYGEALTRARAAGVPFLGAYHVVRSGPPIAAQVDYHLAYVNEATPWWHDFPGWFFQCDLEKWSYDQVAPAKGVDFCTALAARTGRAVLLYAPKWAYGDTIGGSAPLWASSYVTGSGTFRALYPGDTSSLWSAYSGRTPVVLQYSSSATIGRQPGCDANAYRGSVADFANLIGGDMLADERAALMEIRDRARWMDPRIAATADGSTTYQDPAGREHTAQNVVDLKALTSGGISQAMLNTAVAAALADPAVVAGLAKAINDDAAKRLAS